MDLAVDRAKWQTPVLVVSHPSTGPVSLCMLLPCVCSISSLHVRRLTQCLHRSETSQRFSFTSSGGSPFAAGRLLQHSGATQRVIRTRAEPGAPTRIHPASLFPVGRLRTVLCWPCCCAEFRCASRRRLLRERTPTHPPLGLFTATPPPLSSPPMSSFSRFRSALLLLAALCACALPRVTAQIPWALNVNAASGQIIGASYRLFAGTSDTLIVTHSGAADGEGTILTLTCVTDSATGAGLTVSPASQCLSSGSVGFKITAGAKAVGASPNTVTCTFAVSGLNPANFGSAPTVGAITIRAPQRLTVPSTLAGAMDINNPMPVYVSTNYDCQQTTENNTTHRACNIEATRMCAAPCGCACLPPLREGFLAAHSRSRSTLLVFLCLFSHLPRRNRRSCRGRHVPHPHLRQSTQQRTGCFRLFFLLVSFCFVCSRLSCLFCCVCALFFCFCFLCVCCVCVCRRLLATCRTLPQWT